MQNLAWMIEFSYECDSMLHNAWLNIPYVFFLFVEMISDKYTWRKLVRCTYQWGLHGFRSIEPDLFLPLAFLCTIQLHALLLSIFLDFCWSLTSWGSLEMQTQVPPWLSNDVAKSYSSLFVSDMPAVLMIKERSSLVLTWKLHLQWLGDVFGRPWSFMALRDTVINEPLIDDVCWHKDVRYDVVAFIILLLVANVWVGVFEDDGSRHITANKRWVASLLLIFILACLGKV